MRHTSRNLYLCVLCLATGANAHKSSAPLILLPANGNSPSVHVLNLHAQLFDAVQRDDFAAVKKLLVQGANINVLEDDSKCYTPLTYAATNGDMKMTRFLLAHGANPNGIDTTEDGIGFTPLYWTVENGQTECARLLLRAGASAQKGYGDGSYVIDDAIRQGNVSLVNVLIGRMPHLTHAQAHTYRGQTLGVLLNTAVTEGALQDVQTLIKSGADINSLDANNSSSGFGEGFGPPLMRATTHGSLPIMRCLLNHGAKVNLKDESGRTALMYLGENDPYYPQLSPVISLNNKNIGGEPARLLLEKGADIEAKDDSGMTALMYAALGNFRAVEVLLAHGAKVNARDKEGRSALHWAAVWRASKSLEVLLHHGALVNIRDLEGETPLMLASVQPESSTPKTSSFRLQSLKILRRFGANPRLKDKQGRTTADYARTSEDDYITAS